MVTNTIGESLITAMNAWGWPQFGELWFLPRFWRNGLCSIQDNNHMTVSLKSKWRRGAVLLNMNFRNMALSSVRLLKCLRYIAYADYADLYGFFLQWLGNDAPRTLFSPMNGSYLGQSLFQIPWLLRLMVANGSVFPKGSVCTGCFSEMLHACIVLAMAHRNPIPECQGEPVCVSQNLQPL